MEEIVNLISTDASAHRISDEIKNALLTKASEKIDSFRPVVAKSMFDQTETEPEDE
jgi:hypothetical protein